MDVDTIFDGAMKGFLVFVRRSTERNEETKRLGLKLVEGGDVFYVRLNEGMNVRQLKLTLNGTFGGILEIEIDEIGIGAWSAVYNLLSRFFPNFVGFFLEKIFVSIDHTLARVSRLAGKKYDGSEYPLGYLVRARR